MLLGEEAHLLAEAEVYCHRLSRSRTASSLERDNVAARIAATEERLRAMRRRNEELASNVKHLEEALSSCRRRSAQCLPGGQLFHGMGPVQEPRTFPSEEIEEWRALALRIPSRRKNWAEAKTFSALSRAGQAYFWEESLSWHRPDNGSGNDAFQPDSALQTAREGCRDGFYDVSGSTRQERRFEVVATLHAHRDGARSARICQGVLLTAGEDALVKAWDISSMPGTSLWTDSPCEDLEPFVIHRAHTGPVLALAVPDGEEKLHRPIGFSGGTDGDIYSFEVLSPSEHGTQDNMQSQLQRFRAHREVVLSLDIQPKLGLLASAGLDKLVLLWRIPQEVSSEERSEGRLAANAPLQALDIPPPNGSDETSFGPLTGVAWGPRTGAALLLCCSSAASSCCAMDIERGVALYGANAFTREDQIAPVVAVASHAERDVAVSGHADACARVFSPQNGRPMWTLRCGQGKMVTSVAMDPFGSGSEVITCQDGLLQIFDLRTCRCVQEVGLHNGESISSVCHGAVLPRRQQLGSSDMIVTAGGDGMVNLLDRASH